MERKNTLFKAKQISLFQEKKKRSFEVELATLHEP